MPEIVKSYNIDSVSTENLYLECVESIKEIGGTDLQVAPGQNDALIKEVSSTVPSIWGWGGMKVGFKVYSQESRTTLELRGYIAQLGVSPLTSKMDEFLNKLSLKLKSKYNCSFQYEKLTRFLPNYKLNINSDDKKFFPLVLVISFVVALSGTVLGHGFGALLLAPILGFGYYFGRKYLQNKH